jgi:O-antigen ligase
MTGESLQVFFSYEFQRRDAQIFFSLLPMLVALWVAPRERPTRLMLAAFCALQAMVAGAAGVVVLGGKERAAVGTLFQWDEGNWKEVPGFTGLYGAHNAVGSVMALCCLLALTQAALVREPRRRVVWGLLAIPLFAGTVLSTSRGAILSLLAVALLLVGLAVRQQRIPLRWGLLGVLALLAVIPLSGPTMLDRFGDLLEETGTHSTRMEMWRRAFQEWRLSPIVGEGLGRYNDEEREWSGVRHLYYTVTKAKVVNNAAHAHNSYLHFLAEGGILGLGFTAGFWAWVSWRLRKSREPLRVAAFLGVIYLFLISFTEHYMGGGAMLLVLSSLVGAAWNLPEPQVPPAPSAEDGTNGASS